MLIQINQGFCGEDHPELYWDCEQDGLAEITIKQRKTQIFTKTRLVLFAFFWVFIVKELITLN